MPNADRLIELFNEAKARPAGPERERFLAQACPGEPELKAQVISLLQAHEGAGDFLKHTLAFAPTALVTEKPGDTIGRYKLLQELGEGGCGVVYMAEQTEPVRRKVALKVIKLGMDTKQVVARFEAERQALALMDHPNIAKVFDAGATDTGRPHFVMELVRGIKITDYCDQNQLSTTERLDLFIQVCQAVQHAHQKGIIHRDLKPSNVLVTQHDTVAVPKVIDFGIAKATSDQPLTDKTVFTAFEQFVGTPAYMSPEQAQLSGLDIDTRTDIYSLGVLLYELLAGNPPFDPEELMRSGLDGMRRTIREKEPVRPSTRLTQELVAADISRRKSSNGLAIPSEAELSADSRRRLRLKEQIHRVRGDLDWIVMKCLEKDRARRYETANGLAADLKRHLNNEPVVARPPSRWYEFQKTVRRHKFGFGATAAVLLALAAGVVVSTWQAMRATRQQRTAETQRLRAETAEGDAKEKLWSAYLAQARSGRLSGQAGQRFDSLDAVAKATAIRPSIELRNEAIASLALADLRPVPLIGVSAGQPQFVAFDESVERFVRVNATGAVSVCRVPDGTPLMQLPGCMGVGALYGAFSPDGEFLALYHRGGQMMIWNLAGGRIALQLPHDEALISCGFTPDNQFIVAGYEPGQLIFRDLKTGETNRTFTTRVAPFDFSFSRNGEKLAVAFWSSSRGDVLDSRSGRLLYRLPHTNLVRTVAWGPDERTLATGCDDGNAYLWDAATGQKRRTLSGHRGGVNGIVFLDNEQAIASLSWDGTVRLWDTPSGRQTVVLTCGGRSLRFNSRTRLLGVHYNRVRLDLYEVVSPAAVRTLAESPPEPGPGVEFVDFSPDERWLVSGAMDGVRCWDLASGRRIAYLPMQLPRTVLFPPGGTSLITCAWSGLLRWPLSRPSVDEILLGPPQPAAPALNAAQKFVRAGLRYNAEVFTTIHHGPIRGYRSGTNFLELADSKNTTSIATSPDGRWIAAGSWDRGGVKLWNAATGRVVRDFPTSGSTHVAFTPDSRWLAIGALDEYSFWDLATGVRGLRLPRAQSGTLWGPMAFSADGRLMAIARSRRLVHVLDVATGRELASLDMPEVWSIHWLAFSPSGTQLAVASEVVHVWDLRKLRQELAALKLDWDQPPFPAGDPLEQSKPLQVVVDFGASRTAPASETPVPFPKPSGRSK